MTAPRELSLFQAAERLRKGTVTSEALVRSCLEHIQARESQVLAWASLYAEAALEMARQRDREAAGGHWQGPLHGLPLGVKDIYHVRGMETGGGTSAYEGGVAGLDAASVARLRAAGAIFIGKTVTTAFAMGDPGPTRNPWNLEHTPGGSSSGSAAAVAARMIPAALGTQTAGSVIRPAAFNGIVGFKPTHGAVSLAGVLPLSWQLDHVGTLTRTVEDAYLLWHLLRNRRQLEWQDTPDKLPPALVPRRPSRLWRVRGIFQDAADPMVLAALEEQCQRFSRAGVELVERDLPPAFETMLTRHQVIMATEAAAAHHTRFDLREKHYPPKIAGLIREGRKYAATEYVLSLRHREHLIDEMNEAMADVDAAIMPAALGGAPRGLAETGDRRFNVLASYCGLPTVGLPSGLTPQGLPVALQITCRPGRDDDALALAAWCESLIAFNQKPPLA